MAKTVSISSENTYSDETMTKMVVGIIWSEKNFVENPSEIPTTFWQISKTEFRQTSDDYPDHSFHRKFVGAILRIFFIGNFIFWRSSFHRKFLTNYGVRIFRQHSIVGIVWPPGLSEYSDRISDHSFCRNILTIECRRTFPTHSVRPNCWFIRGEYSADPDKWNNDTSNIDEESIVTQLWTNNEKCLENTIPIRITTREYNLQGESIEIYGKYSNNNSRSKPANSTNKNNEVHSYIWFNNHLKTIVFS